MGWPLVALALAWLPLLVSPAGAQSLGITNDPLQGVSVYWPVAAAQFSLRWTTDLGPPITWQPYPYVPTLSGDGNRLVVSLTSLQATNPMAFFQLVSTAVVAAAPSVLTLAAYPIYQTEAFPNGTVQPNGLDTTWWFQWGTDASYGQTTATSVVAGSNTAPVSVAIGMAGLSPGTVYHFQLYGSNLDGIASGGDLTFSTPAPVPPPAIQTLGASNVTSTAAVLQGSIRSGDGQGVIHFQYGTDTTYGGGHVGTYFTALPGDTEFYGYTLTGLAPNTTYHYRAYGFNCCTEGFGNDVTFTTSAASQQPPPTIQTLAPAVLLTNEATLTGTFNPNGADTTAYFEYGLTSAYGSTTAPADLGAGSTTAYVETPTYGLTPGTTYHCQLVAYNSGGTSYGGDVTFTTAGSAGQAPPTVQTGPAFDLTANSAHVTGVFNANGAETFVFYNYGLTSAYGGATAPVDGGSGSASFTASVLLPSLSPNTTYHYQIVAYNSGGTNYGADAVFTTAASSSQAPPTVLTGIAFNIAPTSASLTSVVGPNGDSTSVYFNYGLTSGYGSTSTTASNDTVSGTVSIPITGLAPNTTYHFQVVASNRGGTSYGADATFTTAAQAPPTVETGIAFNIASDSASLTSIVNPNGAGTSVFFNYGLTSGYGSTSTTDNNGTLYGTYSIPIAGLAPSTTYHFQVVASNSGGTSYGADATFTTAASFSQAPPTVQTLIAFDLTGTAASLSSIVNPNGDSTSVYFNYGLTSSYGSVSSTDSNGLLYGTYSIPITGLAPNTTYHFQVVAFNSGGTSYGADATFTTGPGSQTPPTVQTGIAFNLASTAASLTSIVDPNGDSTSVFFNYGLTPGYGSASTTASNDTSYGTVSIPIAGLAPNTTYHFQVVAYNSGGTNYGADATFTTTGSVSQAPPTVQTGIAFDIASTTASLTSIVDPNGDSASVFFNYGLTSSYGSASTTANNDSIYGTVSIPITGLAPNTTYHFQVVAYNSGGTSYGADATFTTAAQAPPAVQTLAPAVLSNNEATLTGAFNPNGADTTVYFEYGLTSAYGSTTSARDLGAGSAWAGVETPTYGLTPNTLYHCRLVGSNSGGTSYGSDVSFTTLP